MDTTPIEDEFNGDNTALRASIKALIELSDRGALAPRPLGGHARNLLASAYRRLGGGCDPARDKELPTEVVLPPRAESPEDTMEKKLEAAIVTCSTRAADDKTEPIHAMQFTQAALNATQALCNVRQIPRRSKS